MVHLVSPSGEAADVPWRIAAETPVQIRVNGEPFTVLFATPADLTELALGLLLTERLIEDTDGLLDVSTQMSLGEACVDLTFEEHAVKATGVSARTIGANSACGLCGIETLAALQNRVVDRVGKRVPVQDRAIRKALAALPSRQPLNTLTRSVHAAAWCSLDGTVELVREDVGRHNALDKLIGALAQGARLQEPGFVLMSSRCSYELVAKSSFLNAQLLASISAPTTLALQWARALDLPLAGAVRREDDWAVVRFSEETAESVSSPPL